LSTELTPLSGKKAIFRGALWLFWGSQFGAEAIKIESRRKKSRPILIFFAGPLRAASLEYKCSLDCMHFLQQESCQAFIGARG